MKFRTIKHSYYCVRCGFDKAGCEFEEWLDDTSKQRICDNCNEDITRKNLLRNAAIERQAKREAMAERLTYILAGADELEASKRKVEIRRKIEDRLENLQFDRDFNEVA